MNDLLSDIPGLDEMDDAPAAASAAISPEDLAALGRIIDPNAWRNEDGYWVEQVNIGDAALDKAEQVLAWVRERFGEAAAPKRLTSPPDLVIVLPGLARGKGRHRTRVIQPKGGGPAFATQYPDQDTKNYEAMLRYAAEQAMAKQPLLEGALKVRINISVPYLKSWSAKKLREVQHAYWLPTTKPDWDNYAKVCDAFNKVVWQDDAQIADGRVVKRYAEKPAFEIKIWTRKGNHW